MKVTTLFVLRAGNRVSIVWRPKILVPNHKIMVRAIMDEEQAARACGRAFEPWKAIHGFQLRTGALRLSNAAANLLLTVVYKGWKKKEPGKRRLMMEQNNLLTDPEVKRLAGNAKDLVLVRIDTAKAALLEARTIQEAKQISDVAEAARIYALRAKLSTETDGRTPGMQPIHEWPR